MYVWRHIPLLRLLVPFILGILLARYASLSFISLAWFATVLTCLLVVLHFYVKRKIRYGLIQVGSVLTIFLFIAMGSLIALVHQSNRYASHISHHLNSDYVTGRVSNLPSVKEKSVGFVLEVESAIDPTSTKAVQGDVSIYVAKDSLSNALRYGDYIIISNKLKNILSPSNPHQFDFQKYYKGKDIYQNAYLRPKEWKSLGVASVSPLVTLGYSWQKTLRQKFKKYFKDENVRGVAQAVVFGYKDDLDDDWLADFSKTGTIHVLAVSGLHVGIIYILLGGLLGLRRSNGAALIVKSGIVLVALFLYCLLTGFAPSVSRATIMFSVVIIAKALNRRSNIYNTLSFSCFLLLVIDPNNLYNVGFQFSFLAVVGIVYYKDIFRNYFPQSTGFGDKVITLMSVSVAAQITTFPIGLYYFHQYPNLFMFSNLIVIPCITVILYAGILFVVISSFSDVLAQWVAEFVGAYITFIAGVVHHIQSVPYAFFENVHISFGQMILLYVLIIALTAMLKHRWKPGLMICLVCVVSFFIIDYSIDKKLSRTEVICFNVRNEILIGLRETNGITFLASKNVYIDESMFDYILKPYLINERLTDNNKIIPLSMLKYVHCNGNIQFFGDGFLLFKNKRYLVADLLEKRITGNLRVDNVVFGKKGSVNFIKKVDELLAYPDGIILNSYRLDSYTNDEKSQSQLSLQANNYLILH